MLSLQAFGQRPQLQYPFLIIYSLALSVSLLNEKLVFPAVLTKVPFLQMNTHPSVFFLRLEVCEVMAEKHRILMYFQKFCIRTSEKP